MDARQELIDQAAGYFMVMEMYILRDGQEVAKGQIEQAFAAGNAVLIHGHGDGKTVTGLMLDGRGIDTRNGNMHVRMLRPDLVSELNRMVNHIVAEG